MQSDLVLAQHFSAVRPKMHCNEHPNTKPESTKPTTMPVTLFTSIVNSGNEKGKRAEVHGLDQALSLDVKDTISG